MSSSFEALPFYLKKYCVTQKYEQYTEREHASWRFIMRQNTRFFAKHAVPIYMEGLKKTGIPLDRIPRISEMDEALSEFGWGAVAVEGFIPPAIFLEFQARGCLPIATDMRTLDHISYTPAPDIVHEAAGHAPIIPDQQYANYLKKYATMAQKAIISREDVEVYEAIRLLSDLKENPDTKPGQVEAAEADLQLKSGRISHVSEATRVARMAWWTVEYGLLGSESDPRIYGAGLLSSVGESQNCLSDKVKRIPLTIECVETSYDITRPQPQLFVATNIQQLEDVLEEFDRTMAYRLGGEAGLERAMKSENVNAIVLDSGVAIGGHLTAYEKDAQGKATFLKFTGPCQICFAEKQMPQQGRERHPEGFSSPIGRWSKAKDKNPSTFNKSALEALGISPGKQAEVVFQSGFVVRGTVAQIHWQEQKLVLITWDNCTVTRGDTVYYRPDWGLFDMVVGEAVTSVHGGPPDKESFGGYNVGSPQTHPGRTSPYDDTDLRAFESYRQIRLIRAAGMPNQELERTQVEGKLERISTQLGQIGTDEWLIQLEILDTARQVLGQAIEHRPWMKQIRQRLKGRIIPGGNYPSDMISKGLELLE